MFASHTRIGSSTSSHVNLGEGVAAPCCMVEMGQVARAEMPLSVFLQTSTFSRLRIKGRLSAESLRCGLEALHHSCAIFLMRNVLILKF